MVDGTIISLLVAAGFVGTLGVLIKYFGMVQLIAGYDPDRVTDEDGLADFVGTNTLYVAALLCLVAIVVSTDLFGGSDLVWLAFIAGVGGLTARMIVGSRRYEASA